MTTKKELAMDLFKQGYSCSQSVLAAFSDELNIDRQTALKISSSFGGGMGRLREVCGTVSGMFMAAGLKYGFSDPKNATEKSAHYERLQLLASQFKQENGSIVCRDLLATTTQTENSAPRKKHSCADLVGQAAELLEKYMQEYPQEK